MADSLQVAKDLTTSEAVAPGLLCAGQNGNDR